MRDYDVTNYSERPAEKKRVHKTRTPEQRAARNERDRVLRARKAAEKMGQVLPMTRTDAGF